MTSNKLINDLHLSFLICKMGVIGELNEIIHVKHLAHHLTQSKDSLNIIQIVNSFDTSKQPE